MVCATEIAMILKSEISLALIFQILWKHPRTTL